MSAPAEDPVRAVLALRAEAHRARAGSVEQRVLWGRYADAAHALTPAQREAFERGVEALEGLATDPRYASPANDNARAL